MLTRTMAHGVRHVGRVWARRTAVCCWEGSQRLFGSSPGAMAGPLDAGFDLSSIALPGEESKPRNTHFDMVVIGGGSGGLACSREAAKLGKSVAVLDYVDPSPKGTTWGLGGTCVNVGCIPKKLMHQAALLGKSFGHAQRFGWDVTTSGHSWEAMTQMVQQYIKSSNFGYTGALMTEGIEYLNAKGRLKDANTVIATDTMGLTTTLTAEHIVVAVGTRPSYLDIPGAEHCITSDDLFSLPSSPGKTLVVGGSYVALECAGFLTGIGVDASVMARSILLRGFDADMADKIGDYMESEGTRIHRGTVPTAIHKTDSGRLLVEWSSTEGTGSMEVDTVMLAVGRHAVTDGVGLEEVGVQMASNKKVVGGEGVDSETSSVPNIFALGDVLQGRPELTPVAIQAGRLLARRLYADSSVAMDYELVPTAVFTPQEYACVGLSEEDAAKRFGEDEIEVHHVEHLPLELAAVYLGDPAGVEKHACYCKVISHASSDKVLGVHVLGPSAGEVLQGFAVAMRAGVTKTQLDDTVGIHPTHAEELVQLDRSKRSGEDYRKTSC